MPTPPRRRRAPLLAFLLALLLAAVSGCTPGCTPESPPADAPGDAIGALRIATLNTEFMFDGRDSEGVASFAWKGDPQAARAHQARIGEVLRGLDADLVMLQEVENEQVMERLVAEHLRGMGYEVYFVQGRDYFTGQDVGLLARVPIDTIGRTDERAPVGASGDDYGVSKNMYARLSLTPGGLPVTLVGVHFLARPTDPGRKDSREAQAEVIRRLVARETASGRAVVVLGDFNDYDDRTPDIAGNAPITDVLARIKRAGPGPEDDLMNVMAEVPQRERYTAHWDRNDNEQVDGREELSAIDHVLLSPALYRRIEDVAYVHRHDPTTHTDHFPIVVTLEVAE